MPYLWTILLNKMRLWYRNRFVCIFRICIMQASTFCLYKQLGHSSCSQFLQCAEKIYFIDFPDIQVLFLFDFVGCLIVFFFSTFNSLYAPYYSVSVYIYIYILFWYLFRNNECCYIGCLSISLCCFVNC